MSYRRLCDKLLLKTVSAPNGHDYRVTKYGADNDPISSFIGQQQGGEQLDFGKPAWSFGGACLNPLHQKIISIKAQGRSLQNSGSTPKYICQGASSVVGGQIESITSITIGGQTVSVDLRSAGSVYDEWSTNSRGTRKLGKVANLGALSWQRYDYMGHWLFYATVSGGKFGVGYGENFGLLATKYTVSAVTAGGSTATSGPDKTMYWDATNPQILVKDESYSTPEDFATSIAGEQAIYELAASTPFTAGSPLTLASGLSPVDQNGDSVTFTETTEATPSPNYPEPIVNSTLISITDGQDTNSAAVDLAGLTDRDEVYVNIKSTNIWDEEWELGGYSSTDGSKTTTNLTIRCKNKIEVEPSTTYYLVLPAGAWIYLYDGDEVYSSPYIDKSGSGTITTRANTKYITFQCKMEYGTTYNHDISISLGSSAVPYMPHDTIGKVWLKQQVGRKDLGNNMAYTYQSSGDYFLTSSLTNRKYGDGLGELCDSYINVGDKSAVQMASQPSGVIAPNNNNINIKIKNTGYTDPTAFKNSLSGVMFYYLLASPIWSDITSTATGAALLAMETYEGDTNTADCLNGDIDVRFWRQV